MGRYISCLVNQEYETVWKYGFATQNSEMGRIYEEFGMGEYYWVSYRLTDDGELDCEYLSEGDMEAEGDILILCRDDEKKLSQKIEQWNGENEEDNDFWEMVKAIRDFMIEFPEQDKFIFEGDF